MKKFRFLMKDILLVIVLVAAALVIILFLPLENKEFIIVGIFAVAMTASFVINAYRKNRFGIAARVIAAKSEKLDKYVNSVSIASAVTDKKGGIIWYNPAFYTLMDSEVDEKNIYKLIRQLGRLEKDKIIEIGGTQYIKQQLEVKLKGKTYYIFRFMDEAQSVEASNLYRIVLGVVAHVQIDNYDDLLRAVPKEEHYMLIMKIEKMIDAAIKNVHGIYQQYQKDKYILVFERRHLAVFMQNKFDIIDKVKRINTNSSVKPTLSIGVGVGNTLEDSNDSALSALDLALGRGGDQAVIKEKQGYKFYGGGQQAPEKRVRVRSRMFSAALRNLFEQCDNVVIMGHDMPDLDCLGAAMGLVACARYLNKKAYIVYEKHNPAIQSLADEIKASEDYKGVLVSPVEAERYLTEKSILIVVDTQIKSHTIAPYIVDKARTLIVIDHHLRGASYIDNATLTYHEPYASSSCEMVVEIVQYFSERIKILPIEAEGLLSGITIDTKCFSFKTGVRTFEAAAYLKRMGADTTSIRHLFQDDMKLFNARAEIVKQAKVINENIAVSYCKKSVESSQLLAAQAADALIGIRGIQASFVLCETDKNIVISGRSLGSVNVQMILEKLGGGGHATIAGAQLECGLEAAEEKLKSAINEYIKERS